MAFVCKLCSWKTDRKGSSTVHLTKRHNIIKENNNIVVDTNTNIQLHIPIFNSICKLLFILLITKYYFFLVYFLVYFV